MGESDLGRTGPRIALSHSVSASKTSVWSAAALMMIHLSVCRLSAESCVATKKKKEEWPEEHYHAAEVGKELRGGYTVGAT